MAIKGIVGQPFRGSVGWRSIGVALAAAVSLSIAFDPSIAKADEPWLLTLEPDVAFPLSSPQKEWFGPGIFGSVALFRAVNKNILVGARLRYGFLFDGPAPDMGFADPGYGTLGTLAALGRFRPGSRDDPRRGTGLYFELGIGGALTGSDIRAMYELGAGYNFELGSVDIGPAVRFKQIFQPNSQLQPNDAFLLSVGLEIVLLDARPEPYEEEEEEAEDDHDGDRDHDGILDPDDQCPTEPEDVDQFEDEDGCPDDDNDQDGIEDAIDECPNQPEDMDDFEDDDGCPDADNDGDGFLDEQDACPNEPETVNGNDDNDGCPDEGLIELVNDRIVLEERVLFDFQRARVKHAAIPVIQAITNLISQHDEWLKMRIEGHADARGDQAYNQRLSERRARNVMRALVHEGVIQERIDFVGYGASRPRDMGRSERAHQRNRRVEFVVVQRTAPDDAPQDENPDMVFDHGGDAASAGGDQAADEGADDEGDEEGADVEADMVFKSGARP